MRQILIKFKSSVGKVINYPVLAHYIEEKSLKGTSIIDVGSGDCSLIDILKEKYYRNVFGIECDDEKVQYGMNYGFEIIHSDIKVAHKYLRKISDPLTIHAGFCFFNIFPLNIVEEILTNLSKLKNVKEFIFEIQNSKYFSKKYPADVVYENDYDDVRIKSWSTKFKEFGEQGVLLNMEYYSLENSTFLNGTVDRLYSHCPNKLEVILRNLGFSNVCFLHWPVRNGVKGTNSHYYILARNEE